MKKFSVTHDTNILVGNSEVGAHVWSEIGNVSYVRHLFRSRANLIFFHKIHVFLHTCATCSELPSNVSTRLSALLLRIFAKGIMQLFIINKGLSYILYYILYYIIQR